MKGKVITIVGPTASGKTALSVRLAKKLGSCVISGDAFQVYRGMDIGTAKVTAREMEGVPHYLVDFLSPEESYTAARFCELAADVIARENAAGRVPVLAGGTGLYVQSLLEGYRFLPKRSGRKSLWQEVYAARGKEGLLEEIRRRAPEADAPLDPQRMIRLLEVLDAEGTAVMPEKEKERAYEGPVIGLTMGRARLYDRINRRVDAMIRAGLETEVRRLLDSGVPEDAQSMRGIGYKEMIPVIRGECSLPEAAALIQKHTRHFAKRQLTWYKRMPYIRWFPLDEEEDADLWYDNINRYITEFLAEC